MKLIVGLGNPGKEYELTRHNVGFFVIDQIVKGDWKKKDNSHIFEDNINGEKIIYLKPQTYMNDSGTAINDIMNYYNIDESNILVIHDDLDLPLGIYKIKKDSGDGGHNGIKSIISNIGNKSFNRLKIGISNNKSIETKNYVLGKFSKNEINKIEMNIEKYREIINSFIEYGIDKTMNIYNTKEN